MKKLTALILTLALTFFAACSLSACNGTDDADKITVAVVQFGKFDALDQANKGFCDRLTEWADANGKKINFKQANAGGEVGNVSTAVEGVLAGGPDVLLAIATPVAVAAAAATDSVPVLYTAVTDPNESGLKGISNVYGTSDMQPVAKQIDLLKDLVPAAKKIAFLFSSEETNSRTQIDLAKAECDKLGLTYEEKTVTDVNSITTAVESISSDVDAIYIPTDNTIALNLGAVTSANSRNLPIVVGESGMVASGGWATLSLSYELLGRQTAEIAVKILEGKSLSDAERHLSYDGAMTLDISDEAKVALSLTDDEVNAIAKKYGG